ncbi:MAG: translation initiation factor IF-2, partial [Fimbriimonadaceae bacterium]|nr:translation initiation factor IF-2 [Fimbriimonadaceae bacterium]
MSQAEVKQEGMQVVVADYAKKHGVSEGVVLTVLSDLGIAVSGGAFESDEETLSLVDEEVSQHSGDPSLVLEPGITLRDLASAMSKPDKDILKFCMVTLKKPMTLTTKLDNAVAEQIAKGFDFEIKWRDAAAPKKVAAPKKAVPTSGAAKRPPVVTILGHVDHGKTSLLDYIRKSKVADKEFGGITQHIGAYQVEQPDGTITFLDTPGHAAFTQMRARGAQVTDIAILVVAADDGIMPQTIEAISHVKSAGVPIIVAVNKIDKADANPDRVLTQLTEHELIAEEYGGDIIVRKVSAITGEGVPELLEMIVLQADIMDLKADPKGDFEGVVIEAKLEKGRGPVATVLVKSGTLQIGDVVICGNTFGKIKAMTDYRGERIKEAGPSMPVEILGLDEVPGAGDKVVRAADEREGREIAQQRQEEKRLQDISGPKRRISLRDIRRIGDTKDVKDLNIIVRADVQGSVEAVRGLIDKLEHPEVNVQI